MSTNIPEQSNKFVWCQYDAPQWSLERPTESNGNREEELGKPKTQSFTMRHLKQGATGAVKTWPVAEVLLDYLVRRDGLRDAGLKALDRNQDSGILDLTNAPSWPHGVGGVSIVTDKCYNVVELGSGSGYLGVGLALSLNREANLLTTERGDPFRPRVRILCTDNDRRTVKNMRHNVTQQPKESMVSKAVAVETLSWGADIGGDKFEKAVKTQFRRTKQDESEAIEAESDPLRLVTHVIASDVHYGVTTLEPLSSVIAAFKLRNPNIVVVILNKERSPEQYPDTAQLKSQIEAKVRHGLGTTEYAPTTHSELDGFSVTVRDVLHRDITNMKIIEC